MNLRVSRVAEIAGCVSGTFYPTQLRSGQLTAAMLAAAPLHTGNVYSNDPFQDSTPHTFCTQSARNASIAC